jgi:hypothetical protein
VIAMNEHSALNEHLRGITHNAEAMRNASLSSSDFRGIAFVFHAVLIASIFVFR